MNRTRTPVIVLAGLVLATALACSSPSGPSGGTGTGPGNPPAGTAVQPAPTGPWTSFGDGQYEVGNQPGMVKPGKYRTTVPTGRHCYWERQSNLSGGLEAIIANDNVNPGSPVVLTILATDKGFKSDGCGEWKLAP